MPKTKEQVRKLAEESAKNDLEKDINQLLIDVHDELLTEYREHSSANLQLENMVHAQKRLASLTVKNAITNTELQKKISDLTRILVILTVILVFLSVVLIVTPFF